MGKILITGGTGLLGSALTMRLLAEGNTVCHLSRSAGRNPQIATYLWDWERNQIDPAALEGVTHIVHLAGAGIADKSWTAARKREILESRTRTSALLAEALSKHPHQVQAVVAASAIGYYGIDTGDIWLDEDAPPGNDFLAMVTKQWEQATQAFERLDIRTVRLRIGVVLAREGGALPKLVQPIRWGAGAALGSGRQYMSWIHVQDLVRMMMYALQQDALRGIYNAVAPQPVTNTEMTIAAAHQLQRPLILPNVPVFALKMMLGEMASIVSGGNRVRADKIQATGFEFAFTQIQEALRDLLTA